MRILIFAKAPVAGAVKTRLAEALTPTQAARLQERLVTHAVEVALQAGLGSVELWCAPDVEHPFFRACGERFSLTLHRQCGDDLGLRMHAALATSLARNEGAILIGSDCAALDAAYLRGAADALGTAEVVIGPAEDGGYVLIGMTRSVDCFSGVPWGSADVMRETRRRLQGVRWGELPMLWDVDRPEDLLRLRSLPGWKERLATIL